MEKMDVLKINDDDDDDDDDDDTYHTCAFAATV